MVGICQELALHQSDKIAGVDGNQLSEYYMTGRGEEDDDIPTALRRECEVLRMEYSELYLHHAAMGPANVFVDQRPGGRLALGVVDWEAVGFVPKV